MLAVNLLSTTLFYFCRFLAQIICNGLEILVKICEWPATRLIRLIKKTEYVRKGSCQMTGQCCRAIGMQFPAAWHKRTRMLNLIKKWHYLRYNFTYIGTHNNMLVYECNYLTHDNKCGIQRFKPALCRDFPKTPLFGVTKLHKGCGFYFARRGASEFEKVLNKMQMPQ